PLAERSPEALGEASEVWEAVQELIKPSLSDGSFRMWFADVEARAVDRTALELFAPSDYVRNWLVTHHMDLLTASARAVIGPQADVHIHVVPGSGEETEAARPGGKAQTAGTERRRGRRGGRDPNPAQATFDEALAPATAFPDRYTFDLFVPGSSNKFAHAAA